MANKENPSSRGKLLVDLATKQEKRCADSVTHEDRYFRPNHSNLKRATKDEGPQIQIKASEMEVVQENPPLKNSDETGQGDYQGMKKQRLDPQPVGLPAFPPSENVNEFELVPSNQDNVYILKPIHHSLEEVLQHSTLEEESDIFNNINFSDVSFNFDQVISEDMLTEGENLSNDKNVDVQVQEDLNSSTSVQLIAELPAVQNAVNEENQTSVSNIIANNEQESRPIAENDMISSEPNNFVQANTPEQENTNECSDPIDLEHESLEGSVSDENCERIQRKRKRNKKPMKHLWTSVKNKEKRMKGEDYCGRRKNVSGKNVFDVKRNKREQKPRCPCIAKRNSVFKCYKFTEERRQKLFTDFWQLDWKERHILVKHLVDKRLVSHRRTNSLDHRRKGSLYYHLSIDDNSERLRVCKKMFVNTFNLGEWAVSNWISKSSENQEDVHQEDEIDQEPNDEGVQSSKNNQKVQKDESNRIKVLKEFFNKLPKLESHYCRKSTQKMYLEPNWQSKAELYRHYRSYCESEGKERYIASDCLFYTVFNELNLGLFSPKKDQCDLCCSFNKGNVTQEEYDAHISNKNVARSEKDSDKQNSNERTAVFTMDMQAVLLSPSLKASALYYKTKLKVHNYTIYNLKTNAAACYIWNESEGGLDADEFSSIITHFIVNEVDRSKVDNVILYSDGCTYQNRNCILSNALLFTANKTGLTITQKFLEKGHTQMECDSMHSVIERKLRNREIYSPSGYVEVCRTARITPSPYKVHYLDHTFFRQYNQLKFVPSIRPGKKKGDPVVTNLRGFLVNWDVQKNVWDHIFSKDCCNVNFSETPLMVTEPYFNFSSIQEAMSEIFFEEYECQSLLRINAGDLSNYKYRKEQKESLCCLVIDCGYSFTNICPYIRDKKYKAGIRRIDIGGKVLTNHLKEIISYRQLHVMDETFVMNQVKEDACYVAQDFMKEMEIARCKYPENTIARDYVLPDYTSIRRGYLRELSQADSVEQQTLRLNNERFAVPELLFHPADVGVSQMGVVEAAVDAVNACPPETQPHLYANVLLVGGCAKFPGFRERLYRDLRSNTPQEFDVNVHLPDDPVTYPWYGGSEFSRDPEFYSYVVTKEEFDEEGHNICFERFDI